MTGSRTASLLLALLIVFFFSAGGNRRCAQPGQCADRLDRLLLF